MSEGKKAKYISKVVKFGGKELTLFSIDGTTWSTKRTELEAIRERQEAQRANLLSGKGASGFTNLGGTGSGVTGAGNAAESEGSQGEAEEPLPIENELDDVDDAVGFEAKGEESDLEGPPVEEDEDENTEDLGKEESDLDLLLGEDEDLKEDESEAQGSKKGTRDDKGSGVHKGAVAKEPGAKKKSKADKSPPSGKKAKAAKSQAKPKSQKAKGPAKAVPSKAGGKGKSKAR